jgi:outer membrane protein assembly factor BamB
MNLKKQTMIRLYLFISMIILGSWLVMCNGGKEDQRYTKGDYKSASWPIFRGDKGLTGVVDGHLPDKLDLMWSFKTGFAIKSSPVIGLGKVYIGSNDGFIYALDFEDGSLIWKFNTEDDIEASPLLVDSSLFFGSVGGDFYALNALSGEMIWKFETGGQIFGSANWIYSPGEKRKRILVGSYDNLMYCFESTSGKLVWTYETEYYINGAPSTDGKNVVFGGCDEIVHIISAEDGKKVGEVEAGSYIAGSAAIADNRAYLGHYGDKLICIDLRSKNILWEYGDKKGGAFFSSPAVNDKYVIIGSRDRALHCVKKTNGDGVWKFRTRNDIDSSPVICGDRVVVGSNDGRIYIIDIKDGSEIWSYEIGEAISSCPAVTGGKIIVGAEDGFVYAFGES